MAQCIYCAGKAGETRDHVPPRSLLRKPYPPDLLTVPSCRECNAGFSKDEDYFRLIAVGIYCQTQKADELFDGAISRSMDRNKNMEDLLFIDSLREAGGSVIVDLEYARIYRVAEKIARGLRYVHVGEAHPPGQRFDVDFFEVDSPSAIMTFGPDFTFCALDGISMSWEFTLFNSLRFTVETPDVAP